MVKTNLSLIISAEIKVFEQISLDLLKMNPQATSIAVGGVAYDIGSQAWFENKHRRVYLDYLFMCSHFYD